MSSIFYRQLGNGHPLILIHGFCETHEIWNGFEEILAKKFQVFAIDLPGFGRSPILQTPFSIEDVGERVVQWIEEKKINQPILIGHSLGGYVSLAMAKNHPDKFAGIVLFQSTAYPDQEERKANRNRVIEFVKVNGIDPFIDTYVPGLFYDKKNAAIPIVDAIARKTSTETLLAYTLAMRDRPSSIDFIMRYPHPILFLGGSEDSIIPSAATLDQGKVAAKGEAHLLSDTGHMAMYESRSEAVSTLEVFAFKTIEGESK